MFYCCLESVNRDIKFQKSLLKTYRNELGKLEKYDASQMRLKMQKKGNHSYYAVLKTENGNVFQKFVKKDHKWVVQIIQKRYFLEQSIRRIETNIIALEKLVSRYRTVDPEIMRRHFPKAYQALPVECYDLAGAIDLKSWGKRPRRTSNYLQEQKSQRTIDGINVRSKSEVILANSFIARGIPYVYEEMRKINGQWFAPDFILVSPLDHREIIWEHFGLLNDPEYRKQFEWKIEQYIAAGYIPGVNLIMTFDDKDGNIDSLMIERTLDLWFGTAA